MKLGLCLKYEQTNYGSKLQALATLRLMEELGHECKVIHYGKAGLMFKLTALSRIFNTTFRQDKIEDWSRNHAFKRHPELAKSLAIRRNIFKEYDTRYFDKYEIRGEYYKDIQELASSFDAIVTCSDQLWSPAGLGTNFYNLMFVPDNVRKVSFASSFGTSKIPWYQKKATIKYLKRIEYVSCRENRGAAIVKELTGRDVPVLMDPIFAFDKYQWEEIIPIERVYDEPYIFCYFLGANAAYREAVTKFAKEKVLKIVTLKYLDQYVDCDSTFGDIVPFNVDPNKFLNLLRGAEYIFTDSFHGCAFSMILHKAFAVFNRYNDNSEASKNSRIETVCGNLGLNNKRVNADSDLNAVMADHIDWNAVDKKAKVFKDRMREYLNEAIGK